MKKKPLPIGTSGMIANPLKDRWEMSELKSKCHGVGFYIAVKKPTLREIREERIPLEFMTQPEYQRVEMRCLKCHKLFRVA